MFHRVDITIQYVNLSSISFPIRFVCFVRTVFRQQVLSKKVLCLFCVYIQHTLVNCVLISWSNGLLFHCFPIVVAGEQGPGFSCTVCFTSSSHKQNCSPLVNRSICYETFHMQRLLLLAICIAFFLTCWYIFQSLEHQLRLEHLKLNIMDYTTD